MGNDFKIPENSKKESFQEKYTRKIEYDDTRPLTRKERRIATRKGKRGGKKGFPRVDENGNYYSPDISEMIHAYDQYESEIWAQYQTDSIEKLASLRNHISRIADIEKEIEIAKKELEEFCKESEKIPIVRKNGEEELSEAAVYARRTRDTMRQKAALSGRVSTLNNELSTHLREISGLRSWFFEADNATRLISQKVASHTQRLLDCLWNGALKTHPQRDSLPAKPNVKLTPRGEQLFFEFHGEMVLEDAKTVLEKYNSV